MQRCHERGPRYCEPSPRAPAVNGLNATAVIAASLLRCASDTRHTITRRVYRARLSYVPLAPPLDVSCNDPFKSRRRVSIDHRPALRTRRTPVAVHTVTHRSARTARRIAAMSSSVPIDGTHRYVLGTTVAAYDANGRDADAPLAAEDDDARCSVAADHIEHAEYRDVIALRLSAFIHPSRVRTTLNEATYDVDGSDVVRALWTCLEDADRRPAWCFALEREWASHAVERGLPQRLAQSISNLERLALITLVVDLTYATGLARRARSLSGDPIMIYQPPFWVAYYRTASGGSAESGIHTLDTRDVKRRRFIAAYDAAWGRIAVDEYESTDDESTDDDESSTGGGAAIGSDESSGHYDDDEALVAQWQRAKRRDTGLPRGKRLWADERTSYEDAFTYDAVPLSGDDIDVMSMWKVRCLDRDAAAASSSHSQRAYPWRRTARAFEGECQVNSFARARESTVDQCASFGDAHEPDSEWVWMKVTNDMPSNVGGLNGAALICKSTTIGQTVDAVTARAIHAVLSQLPAPPTVLRPTMTCNCHGAQVPIDSDFITALDAHPMGVRVSYAAARRKFNHEFVESGGDSDDDVDHDGDAVMSLDTASHVDVPRTVTMPRMHMTLGMMAASRASSSSSSSAASRVAFASASSSASPPPANVGAASSSSSPTIAAIVEDTVMSSLGDALVPTDAAPRCDVANVAPHSRLLEWQRRCTKRRRAEEQRAQVAESRALHAAAVKRHRYDARSLTSLLDVDLVSIMEFGSRCDIFALARTSHAIYDAAHDRRAWRHTPPIEVDFMADRHGHNGYTSCTSALLLDVRRSPLRHHIPQHVSIVPDDANRRGADDFPDVTSTRWEELIEEFSRRVVAGVSVDRQHHLWLPYLSSAPARATVTAVTVSIEAIPRGYRTFGAILALPKLTMLRVEEVAHCVRNVRRREVLPAWVPQRIASHCRSLTSLDLSISSRDDAEARYRLPIVALAPIFAACPTITELTIDGDHQAIDGIEALPLLHTLTVANMIDEADVKVDVDFDANCLSNLIPRFVDMKALTSLKMHFVHASKCALRPTHATWVDLDIRVCADFIPSHVRTIEYKMVNCPRSHIIDRTHPRTRTRTCCRIVTDHIYVEQEGAEVATTP